MLTLFDKNYLSKGNARLCYYHPINKDLCLKINKPNMKTDQNQSEFIYLQYFNWKIAKFNDSNSILPIYHGKTKTNLGDALIYDVITDYNGKKSKSLAFYYANKMLTKEQVEHIIRTLALKSIQQNILIYDANMSNILMQKKADGSLEARLIDGFSARRVGLKMIFRCLSKSLTRRKTKKSFDLLLFRLENYTKERDPGFLNL